VLKTDGGTVWLTGLPAAGKSTIAETVQLLFREQGLEVFHLDGDELRSGLNADLAFTASGRAENVRRLGEVALLLGGFGHLALVSAISPYRADRAKVRNRHKMTKTAFIEVYVTTPLEVCEARDPKGHYARARRGEIQTFTGVSAPYEAPNCPDVRLDTMGSPIQSAIDLFDAIIGARLVKEFGS